MEAGAVLVHDHRGKPLGWALWSPLSEISLRLLDRDPDAVIDQAWWDERIASSIARRVPLEDHTNAFRLIHGEADGCPSLVCDRYDDWLVVQFMSAGLEAFREEIVASLRSLVEPAGNSRPERCPVASKRRVGARNCGSSRGSSAGDRGPRIRGEIPGRAVDRTKDGRIPRSARESSFRRNGRTRKSTRLLQLPRIVRAAPRAEGDARHGSRFIWASSRARRGECGAKLAHQHLVRGSECVRLPEGKGTRGNHVRHDSPRSARVREDAVRASGGHARLQGHQLPRDAPSRPGGLLYTASCSFHLTKPLFLEMLESAAADSGRRIAIRALTGQPLDHPEVLTIPETGYIKGALLEVME